MKRKIDLNKQRKRRQLHALNAARQVMAGYLIVTALFKIFGESDDEFVDIEYEDIPLEQRATLESDPDGKRMGDGETSG